jgi:hypothetical protein
MILIAITLMIINQPFHYPTHSFMTNAVATKRLKQGGGVVSHWPTTYQLLMGGGGGLKLFSGHSIFHSLLS